MRSIITISISKNNLRAFRQLRKLTLKRLESLTGINYGTIWRTEQGLRKTTPRERELLSRALAVSEKKIFWLEEKNSLPRLEEKRMAPIGKTVRFLKELRYEELLEHRGLFIEYRSINHRTRKVHQLFCNSLDNFIKAISPGARGVDKYFGPHPRNSKNGSSQSVSTVTCLFADMDFKNFEGEKEEACRTLEDFRFEPTVIVDSGHGLHPYFFLKEPEDLDDPKEYILNSRGLQRALGSDRVHDLARIMRIPGTDNLKDPKNPRPCHIVSANYDRRYSLDDFEMFRDIETGPEQNQEATPNEREFREGRRNSSLTSLAGTMRRRGMTRTTIEVALQHENQRRCHPPLPDEEGFYPDITDGLEKSVSS